MKARGFACQRQRLRRAGAVSHAVLGILGCLALSAQAGPQTGELCPPGSLGLPPDCRPAVRSFCPEGTVGIHPNCRPSAPGACPPGSVGIQPTCRVQRESLPPPRMPEMRRPPATIDPRIPLP